MIRQAILSALVSGAAFLSAAEKFPGSVTDASGVNIHFTDAKPGELEMLKAAGFKHIRMDFSWGATEKQKGVYDFSAYDRLTASLEKHGLKGYYILDYANPHYEKERSVRTPEGRAAYAKWAAAAVSHFKGRGICWEIWNEPNGGFWSPIANVEEYSAMAVEASKAIRAVDPDAILTGPATSTIDMAFLEGCFKAGLLEYWDAVTVHPYRQTGPESVTFEYDALRRLIAQYQPKSRPPVKILSGEWGYSSVWLNHDDESQGKMLSRQWLTNAANCIPVSIWYDWHDDGPDPKEAEHNFGTTKLKYYEGRNPVYDPKPAYDAAKTFNTILNGYSFVKSLSLGNIEHQALLFRHASGKSLVAAWTTASGSRSVHLPSDDGTFKVTDHLGKTLPDLTVKDGMAFEINDSPRYFEFSGDNKKLAAATEALLMRIAIVPATGKEVLVKIENLSGKAFKAKLELRLGSASATDADIRDVSVPSDIGVTDVAFPFPGDGAPASGYEAAAKLEIDGKVVTETGTRFFSAPNEEALKGSRAAPEGDPKVGGTFTLSQADAPEKFPGGNATVMKLDYDFQPGWKYVPIHPGGERRKLEGHSGQEYGRALFGIWIYGDSSHLAARVRVKDASGRVWQPSAPEIKWKGWKYVEMKLDEGTAHWGGEDDKLKRGPKFPLTWESPFLFDNTNRNAAKGTVYFTMPVMILE